METSTQDRKYPVYREQKKTMKKARLPGLSPVKYSPKYRNPPPQASGHSAAQEPIAAALCAKHAAAAKAGSRMIKSFFRVFRVCCA